MSGLREQGHLGIAAVGFALGTANLLGVRQIETRGGVGPRHRQADGLPVGSLVAVGVDLLLGGILVGLSVATLGRTQGVALTIALTLVILPLALSRGEEHACTARR